MSDSSEITKQKFSKPIAALAGISLAMGLGWTLSSGLKHQPADLVTSQSLVELAFPYRGACSEVEVYEGDRQLELRGKDIRSGLARFSLQLPPGQHELKLRFRGLIPGLDKDYEFTTTVDHQAPTLSAELVGTETVTVEEQAIVKGEVEVGSKLFLEGAELKLQSTGQFETDVPLKPGWNHLLLSAVDPAGNTTKSKISVFRDTADPELDWQTKPDEAFKKTKARLVLDLKDDGKIVGVSGKVDGKEPIQWFAKGGSRWVGTTPDLHEGFHEVTVKAVDESGRVVSGQRQVIIDSSEALGEAVLGLGARGEDVRLLHERLIEAGYLPEGPVASVFNKATEKAIRELQKAEGYAVTGKAEGEALVALGPRIFINLSKFSLVLDRPGQKQRRWMIASGSYAHPTPVGKFVIKEKVPHPTWLPPKSDWAKDAKPIPPGPGNPLGTRWLGFDWGGVGIHGTNAPWSIGTASSHGCLRMVTGQVEELFELVEVGTPVVVLGGWEQNPALERYWPKNPPSKEKTAKAESKEQDKSAKTEESESEKESKTAQGASSSELSQEMANT